MNDEPLVICFNCMVAYKLSPEQVEWGHDFAETEIIFFPVKPAPPGMPWYEILALILFLTPGSLGALGLINGYFIHYNDRAFQYGMLMLIGAIGVGFLFVKDFVRKKTFNKSERMQRYYRELEDALEKERLQMEVGDHK